MDSSQENAASQKRRKSTDLKVSKPNPRNPIVMAVREQISKLRQVLRDIFGPTDHVLKQMYKTSDINNITSIYTQVPLTTIQSIVRNDKNPPPPPTEIFSRATIAKSDYPKIREIIGTLFSEGRPPFSVECILRPWLEFKRETDPEFNVSGQSLKRALKLMRYSWKKTKEDRLILTEQPHIVEWRNKYLKRVEALRAAGIELFYLDETWKSTGLNNTKSWSAVGEERETVSVKIVGKGERLIILNVGSENGWVKNGLEIYDSTTRMEDYHEEMNSTNFLHYMKHKLLPDLPDKCALIIDNAPYHSKLLHGTPKRWRTKSDILQFYEYYGVTVDKSLTIDELCILNDEVLHLPKVYMLEEVIKKSNKDIQIVRLPPYHCHLNPIELQWHTMKMEIDKGAVCDSDPLFVRDLIIAATLNSDKHWKGCCEHAIKKENMYRNQVPEVLLDVEDDIIVSDSELIDPDQMCNDIE